MRNLRNAEVLLVAIAIFESEARAREGTLGTIRQDWASMTYVQKLQYYNRAREEIYRVDKTQP